MTESKDLQEEFITSLKALMIRYDVELNHYVINYDGDVYYFENNAGSIHVNLDNLTSNSE